MDSKPISIEIRKERHFPYWVQRRVVTIDNITMYVDYNTGGLNQTPVTIPPLTLPGASGNLPIGGDLLVGGRSAINDIFLFMNFSLNTIG